MKIRSVDAFGLRGGTPEGGWTNELAAETCVHTLIRVTTDEGLTGWGSVFTSGDLVRASLQVLEPLLIGESAIEPERVGERLHQHTFWQGRGGAITHTISGIDTALWDILGKATGQPMGRLMGGRYRERVRPYASLLMSEPRRLQETLAGAMASGFTAFKIGWGPFGRHDDRLDEDIVADAQADRVTALTQAREHMGHLQIPAARALLEPLAAAQPDDFDVCAALYRCARLEPRTPNLMHAARTVLALTPRAAAQTREQKAIFEDALKAGVPASAFDATQTFAMLRRWPMLASGADAAKALMQWVERAPATPGLPAACLGVARDLRARGESANAKVLLDAVVATWPGDGDADKARLMLSDGA